MADSEDSTEVSQRADCIRCGGRVEDGTVKDIDRWIVEEGGGLICPDCQNQPSKPLRERRRRPTPTSSIAEGTVTDGPPASI